MARKPRIHYPGALYHVILRGNARQDVFSDEKDRYRFYLLMQEGIERYGHRVLAFCLMTNHIHLALLGDILGDIGSGLKDCKMMIHCTHGT